MPQVFERGHLFEPKQPERLREGCPAFQRADNQRAGEAFAYPGAQRQVEVAAATPWQGAQACEFFIICSPVFVSCQPPGIVDTAQNNQCADFEAPRQTTGFVPQFCAAVVLIAEEVQRDEQFGSNLIAPALEAMVGDLEAVTEGLPGPFPLIGMSQGGAVAIEFTRRNPGRVSRLVLVGAYARGSLMRPTGQGHRREAEALLALVRLGWGRDNPAFRQVFTNQFIPGGTPEQHRWWTDLERRTASPEVAAAILSAFYQIDVTDQARALDLPVLVMHARGDARVPFDEGRLLASLIPGARFVPLESDNHVLLDTEAAWGRFLLELRGFLGEDGGELSPLPGLDGLTNAERQVMELLLQGLDNRTIASRSGKSEKTVRNQVSAILSKTGHPSRGALIAARDRSG